MHDIEVDPNSDIANDIWDLPVKTFWLGVRMLTEQIAEETGESKHDVVERYSEINDNMARDFMQRVWDESENIQDQLIHYQMLVVTFALNASGLLTWATGMSEIEKLVGDAQE